MEGPWALTILLISAGQHFADPQVQQGVDSGHVALQRTVALNGNEAPLGAKPLALVLDDLGVVRVQLWNNHGNVRGYAVLFVVGDDRALQLGIALFQGQDVLGVHIDSTEHKVYERGHGFPVFFRVIDRKAGHLLWNRGGHGPAALHGLTVGLSRRRSAGRQGGDFKPGVSV